MKAILQGAAVMTLLVTLAACNSSDDEVVEVIDAGSSMDTIRGTVTYEEDIILAPESVTRVELLDVTAPDESPTVIAESFVNGFGTPPLAFALEYDTRLIESGHRYALRAEVMEQTRLMFKSIDTYRVLDNEHTGPVEILLKHVPGGKVERMAEVVRANNPMFSGYYYYFDGEGEFLDCEDQEIHPVAREGDIYALESSYRREAGNFGDQVFTRISGNYVTRPARDGRGKEDFLVVIQVEEMDAGGACP